MATLAAFVAAFVLPGFAPFATGPHGGSVWTGLFPEGERPGYVYLPPAYDPSRSYPVVYLLHGMPGSPSEYLAGTDLADYADDGIASGQLRPFIAVMPAAGPSPKYNGEWAGPWETELVSDVLPFVDDHLSTIAAPSGRTLAGLSAGGFGAFDIALRHPDLFGAVESWSGYFEPLHDGPFKHAPATTLAANDPVLLARREARTLRAGRVRFFVSTGPAHSHWIPQGTSLRFANELARLGLTTTYRSFPDPRGQWREQLDAGLTWAFAR